MNSIKEKLHVACFVILFLLICVICFQEQLFTGPSFIHAWAQGDRYSLAINFYDNGMNFFKPATSNLHSENGITGVEFPIQAYLAAALGHIFGRENISICFKLITIFISGMGLYALFLTAYKRTRDVIFSLLTPMIIFCSPVFLYYTCNYLPDTAGASFAFMSFYFIAEHFDKKTKKSSYIALSLLTIGTLIKTSVGIYLIGFMGWMFLYRTFGKERTSLRSNIVQSLLSVLFLVPVIASYKYNVWLNETYGSYIFLASAKPWENWQMFKEFFNGAFKHRWVYDYLALPAYFVCFAIVVTGVFLMSKSITGRKFILLSGIFLVGSLCMFYLMGAQFGHHDYYFIAIAMPSIAFPSMASAVYIHQKGRILPVLRISFTAILVVSFFVGHNQFKKRFEDSMELDGWSHGGDKVLDSVGVGRREPILLVNELASNIPLSHLDRRGYHFYFDSFDHTGWFMIDRLREYKVRVIVLRTETERKMKEKDPHVFDQFTHLITTDHMAVYRFNGL